MAEAIRIMETHIDGPLTIVTIAHRVGLLDARAGDPVFLPIVDVSPGAYYLTLRLNAARRLVVDTNPPIADIAERTGFSAIASLVPRLPPPVR